jgi:serine/threonine protein kinase
MIGQTIAHYKITAKLGEGGMGVVYRAEDTKLGRTVAIKILSEEFASDRERYVRFDREARLLASLNHPNIATIHGLEELGDCRAIVLELVEGPTLADLLSRGPLSLGEALRIGRQIAEALEAAHLQGIVHRDLKPSNIKLTSSGRVKVLDFGLAKSVAVGDGTQNLGAEHLSATATRVGTIVGTAAYMSPEQAVGGTVNRRADIWAFGALLYEMLTGSCAFPGKTVPEILAGVLAGEVNWTLLPPDLPTTLTTLIKRCLTVDADRRLADISEARATLDALSSPAPGGIVGEMASAAAAMPDRSIVVLPFTNISSDAENEYFSDGLTEEIIADLSKVGSLRVISRTTTMRLKGAVKDLRAIAGDLRVRYALEGSVRKSGSNLRITAQLIDTQNDSHLWSEKYSGTLDDVFGIQERVSRAIVEALQIRLTADEDRRLARRPTSTGFAYDTYMRARRDIFSFSKDRLDRACAEMKHAISIVGDDPLLYRGMGTGLWQYVNAGFSSDPKYLDEAEAYARKLQDLDPTGPHAAALLGYIAAQRGDMRGCVRGLQRALAVDPNDPDLLFWLGAMWVFSGHPQHSRPLFQRLLAIDSFFDLLYYGLGLLECCEARFASAIELYERGRALTPDQIAWVKGIAQAMASLGDVTGAIDLIEECCPDPSVDPFACLSQILAHALRGERDAAERLATSEFKSRMWGDFQYTHDMAQCYALLGDLDQGLRWLQRSTERGFIHYPFLSTRDPLLENLRSDPRFHTLMEKVRHEWETFEESVR